MVNGQSKDAPTIVVPPEIQHKMPALTCHRFFAPVVFPEPDALDPRKVRISPKMGNFDCIKARCTLWNAEKAECYDVTGIKAQILMSEYAFNKMNDVHIQEGGA